MAWHNVGLPSSFSSLVLAQSPLPSPHVALTTSHPVTLPCFLPSSPHFTKRGFLEWENCSGG